MKVFDNIHKWAAEHKSEIGSATGYPADIENILVSIVTDLKDLRKSQTLTRQYYDNKLRFSTHAKEHYRIIQEQALNGIEVEDWEYKPNNGEYEVPEDLLHDALLSVIMDDKYSFGYLYWHLASEVNRTQGMTYDDSVIPAEVINFAIDFDIDELKKEFMSQPTPQEKKMFAVLRKADCALVLNLDNNEILASLKDNFDAAAQVLIGVAEQEMEITGKEQDVSEPTQPSQPRKGKEQENRLGAIRAVGQAKAENEPHKELAYLEAGKLFRHKSDIFYFNIWGAEYDKLRDSAKTKGVNNEEYKQFVDKKVNASAFVQWLAKRFRWLVFASQLDVEMTFSETKDMLRNSLKSFLQRLPKEYDHMSLSLYSDIANWAREILPLSTTALSEAEDYLAELVKKGDLGGSEEINVRKCMSFYHYQLCKYANALVFSAFTEISEKQKWGFPKHILYNYWGTNYEQLREDAESQLIKSDDEHRMINCFRNYDYFYEQFNSQAIVFANDKVNSKSYSTHKKELKEWLHRLEVDYLNRIQSQGSPTKKELEYALEAWSLCTSLAVMVEFAHMGEQAHDELYESNDWSDEALAHFSNLLVVNSEVTGVIGSTLLQKREEFHQNLERLIESHKITIPTAVIEDASKEEILETNGGPAQRNKFITKDFCTINVDVIYEFIKNQEVTDLTKADFQYAIDYADFSALQADAKKKHCSDYPACIITHLKSKFEDDWYETACNSIGKTKARVSGYHHENGVMNKIHRFFPNNLTK